MSFRCQPRSVQAGRVSLLIVATICSHAGLTLGDSVVLLNEPSGEFQSPGYPDLDDDMNCTWNIVVPLNHKITVAFLDFDLEDQPICNDEVEIHDGNVKNSTYRGTELHGQNITSSSNTMSVVLMSCSSSLLFDRRGIRALYSTVYPSTSPNQTSRMVHTVPFFTLSSTPAVPSPTEYFGTSSLPNSAGQGLLYAIIGAVLAVLFFTIIVIVLVLLMRKRATSPSKASTAHSRDSETNQRVATKRSSLAGLDDGYIEVEETQINMDSVYYSRDIPSTKLTPP